MACQICGHGDIAVVLCGRCVPDPIPPRPIFRRDRKKKAKGNHCYYCGSKENLTTDHFIPRCRGGSNDPTNLVVACYSCNNIKDDMYPSQFMRHMGWDKFHDEKEEEYGL